MDLIKLFRQFFSVRLLPGNSWFARCCSGFVVCFALSIISCVYESLVTYGPLFDADTKSYFKAAVTLSEGRVDVFRTPGYPCLIHIFQSLFGHTAGVWMQVIVQEIILLFSSILLWDVAKFFIRNNLWVNIVTAGYILLPVVLHYNFATFLIPESLVLSGCVLLLWVLFGCYKYSRRRISYKYPFFITLIVIFLISLKPVFIYLLMLLPIYWGYFLFSKKQRFLRGAFLGFFGLGIVFALVLLYRDQVKKEYGINSVSAVTIVNNYFFVRQYCLLNTEYMPNEALRKEMDFYIKAHGICIDSMWNECASLICDTNYVSMENTVNSSITKSIPRSVGCMAIRFTEAARIPMWRKFKVYCSMTRSNYSKFEEYMAAVYNIFVPTFTLLNGFLLVYLVYMVVMYVKYRKFEFLNWFLWLYVVAGYAVAVMGAMNDWARLTVQILPGVLLLFGRFLSLFQLRPGCLTGGDNDSKDNGVLSQ